MIVPQADGMRLRRRITGSRVTLTPGAIARPLR